MAGAGRFSKKYAENPDNMRNGRRQKPNPVNTPLAGRHIIVTRSRTQAASMVSLLERAGAEVLALPTIRIESPGDPAPLLSAIEKIAGYDWILFTSTNAVEAFMRLFSGERPGERLNSFTRIAAVGKATADSLAEFSVSIDFRPEKFTGEALAENLMTGEALRGRRILLPRSDIAPKTVIELLRSRGAVTDEVVAYHTLPEEKHRTEYNRLFEEESIDMITFTSSSTAENLIPLLSVKSLSFFREKLLSASIGPVTTKTLLKFGVTPAVEPEEHTVEGLVEAVIAYYA